MRFGDRARVVAQGSFLTLSEFLGRNQPAPDFPNHPQKMDSILLREAKDQGSSRSQKLRQRRRPHYRGDAGTDHREQSKRQAGPVLLLPLKALRAHTNRRKSADVEGLKGLSDFNPVGPVRP